MRHTIPNNDMSTTDQPRGSSGSRGLRGSGRSASSDRASSGSLPVIPPRAALLNANALVNNNVGGSESANQTSTTNALQTPTEDEHDESVNESNNTTVRAAGTSGVVHSRTSPRRDRMKERERETASPTALRAQLRQKEELISSLRQELDEASTLYQTELERRCDQTDMTDYWKEKHSKVNQQYLQTDLKVRILEADNNTYKVERKEFREEIEARKRHIVDREKEIHSLKSQVRGLKEFLSTSTRTDGQTSDETFGEAMAKLGNGLQNWVITHFRKAKIDLGNLDEPTLSELADLVPMYEELAKAVKGALLQSVVSKILVSMIFDAYFVGLSPEQTNLVRQMEQLLLAASGNSEAVINQWRATTLSIFHKGAPQLLQNDSSNFAEQVVARINHILGSMTDTTSSTPRDTALRVLVNNSIELARMLVMQKAVLRVYMPVIQPHQQVFFDPDTMEDIGGEDEEALTRREIWCVAFPGIVKRGDENGAQMGQYRNVISKARVLCSPQD